MPRSPPTNSSIIITPYTQSSLLSVIIIYIQQMNAVVTGNYDMVRDPPPFFHAGFRSYGFLLEIEFNCPALLAGLNNIGRQGILAAFTSCSVSFFLCVSSSALRPHSARASRRGAIKSTPIWMKMCAPGFPICSVRTCTVTGGEAKVTLPTFSPLRKEALLAELLALIQ